VKQQQEVIVWTIGVDHQVQHIVTEAAQINLIYNVHCRSSHGTAAQSSLVMYNVHCRSSSFATAAQHLIRSH
jgi:hypothetical protein